MRGRGAYHWHLLLSINRDHPFHNHPNLENRMDENQGNIFDPQQPLYL